MMPLVQTAEMYRLQIPLPRVVPFLLLSESQAQRNHQTSLADLANRGGLDIHAMMALLAATSPHTLCWAMGALKIVGLFIGLLQDRWAATFRDEWSMRDAEQRP